ncbi:hypothetical protein [Streptomyces sp. NPDC097619]|uniref:hypothetical protein n=1 Tax=Streptomyces sp. NPDC097619 TaxID=3157228 RepID=UPI00332FBB4E
MNHLPELRVEEEDMGADVITLTKQDEGVTYLFVRPGQSFESAVRGIQRVCPELTIAQAQELVRTHCPRVIEMNVRLGSGKSIPRFEAAPAAGVLPPLPGPADEATRRSRFPRWAQFAAVAIPAIVGGVLFAQLLHPLGNNGSTETSTGSPTASQEARALAGTYKGAAFQRILAGGRMTCDPLGPYEAKCVDADGTVMFSEASVGTSTAFTFSYGLEKVGFRVFPDGDAAAAWAAEEKNSNLYEGIRRDGRVVLWGTDEERLDAWAKSLARPAAEGEAPGGPQPSVLGSAALPDRLAFLAVGTLGFAEESIARAPWADDTVSVVVLQAARLVLGSAHSSPLGIVPAGSDDAVAAVLDGVKDGGRGAAGASASRAPRPTTSGEALPGPLPPSGGVTPADPVPTMAPTPQSPAPFETESADTTGTVGSPEPRPAPPRFPTSM